MAQDSVEIVRRGFEAWNREDYEEALRSFAADIEIDVSDRVFNPGVYAGVEGARRLVDELADTWGAWHLEIEDIRAAGDEVVVLVHTTGEGRSSGTPVESRVAWVATVRDGEITRLRLYRDRADALAAVGLDV